MTIDDPKEQDSFDRLVEISIRKPSVYKLTATKPVVDTSSSDFISNEMHKTTWKNQTYATHMKER